MCACVDAYRINIASPSTTPRFPLPPYRVETKRYSILEKERGYGRFWRCHGLVHWAKGLLQGSTKCHFDPDAVWITSIVISQQIKKTKNWKPNPKTTFELKGTRVRVCVTSTLILNSWIQGTDRVARVRETIDPIQALHEIEYIDTKRSPFELNLASLNSFRKYYSSISIRYRCTQYTGEDKCLINCVGL